MKCGQCRYYIEGTCYRFPPYGGKSRSRVGKDEICCGEFRTIRPEYVREDHIPKPKTEILATISTASSSKVRTSTTTTSKGTDKGD